MTKELKGLFPEGDNNQLKIHELTIDGYKIATLKLSADTETLEGEALKDRLKELVDLLFSKSKEADSKRAKLYHIIDLRKLRLINIMYPGLLRDLGIQSLLTKEVQDRMGFQIVIVEENNQAVKTLGESFSKTISKFKRGGDTHLYFVQTPKEAYTLMNELIIRELGKQNVKSSDVEQKEQ